MRGVAVFVLASLSALPLVMGSDAARPARRLFERQIATVNVPNIPASTGVSLI
jgi:hypothetical protein